jgi:hypothetical protein
VRPCQQTIIKRNGKKIANTQKPTFRSFFCRIARGRLEEEESDEEAVTLVVDFESLTDRIWSLHSFDVEFVT